ncbi:BQ5605_C025g10015 [Microbotryum silenes-dioicae]|uniref:BQ5605_C025g10015 protein n=1 Tax=Microbotryum silenes-dioicae TaxID=796604 RepID=A0A2X0MQ20_9BASI|nr:BQ5605_C025g10015 [Microbotryum silenes-dioicae]
MPWAPALQHSSSNTPSNTRNIAGNSNSPMEQPQRWVSGEEGTTLTSLAVPTISANDSSASRFRDLPRGGGPSGSTLASTGVTSSVHQEVSPSGIVGYQESANQQPHRHDPSLFAQQRWFPRINYLGAGVSGPSSRNRYHAASDQLASDQGSPTLGAATTANASRVTDPRAQHHGHCGDARQLQGPGMPVSSDALMSYDTFRDPASPQGSSSVASPNAPWSPASTSQDSSNRGGYLDHVLTPFDHSLFAQGGSSGGGDGGGAAASSASVSLSGAAGPAPAPGTPGSSSTSSPGLGGEAAAPAAGNPSSIFGGDSGDGTSAPVFDPLEHYISSFGPFSAPSTSSWIHFEHAAPSCVRPRSFSHSHEVASLFAPQEMGRNNVLGLIVTSSPAPAGTNTLCSNTAATPTMIKRFEGHHLQHHSAGPTMTATRSFSSNSAPPSFPLALPALPAITNPGENRRASLPTINHDVRRDLLNRSMSNRNGPNYSLPIPYLPSNRAFDSSEGGSNSAHFGGGGHFHPQQPDGTKTLISNEMNPESPPSPFAVHESHSPSSSDSYHHSVRKGGVGTGGSRRPRSSKRSPKHNERGERISPVTGKPVRLLRKRSFPPKDAEKRVYVCTITGCSRRFGRPSARDTHVRTHTGAKRKHIFSHYLQGEETNAGSRVIPAYVCPVASCARSFSVFSNLKRHMIIHPSLDFRNVSVHDLPKICCHEDGNDLRLEWLSTDREPSSPTVTDAANQQSNFS